MNDVESLHAIKLVGIKGWLLFYVMTTIIGFLYLLFDPMTLILISHLAFRLVIVFFIGARLVSLYLIFLVRKSITRKYHIWLHLIEAWVIALFSFQLEAWPTGLGGIIVMLTWAAYWIGSKRVRATYCK